MQEDLQQILGVAKKQLPKDELGLFRSFVELYKPAIPKRYRSLIEGSELAEFLVARWQFLKTPISGPASVAVSSPGDGEAHDGSYTALELRLQDRPFIVDSVKESLRARGLDIQLIIHPVLGVERGPNGSVVALRPGTDKGPREAYLYLHCDRLATEADQRALASGVQDVLQMVCVAVDDYSAMQAAVREVANDVVERPEFYVGNRTTPAQKSEFLNWLLDGNFTFLGCRRAAADGKGIKPVKESATGLFRTEPVPAAFVRQLGAEMTRDFEAAAARDCALGVSRLHLKSPVHRFVEMDCISMLKRNKDGRPESVTQIIGLFTSAALLEKPHRIPVIRERTAAVLRRLGYLENSYSQKKAVMILNTLPKEFLFNWLTDDLYEEVETLMGVEDHEEIFVSLRPKPQDQRVTVTVQMPEADYSGAARDRIVAQLTTALQPAVVRHFRSQEEGEMMRLHVYTYQPGVTLTSAQIAKLQEELRETLRPWQDRLSLALRSRWEGARGRELARKFANVFPEAYRTSYSTDTALFDVEQIEKLLAGKSLVVRVLTVRRAETGEEVTGVRLYRQQKMLLSEIMPVLTNLGLRVIEERATDVHLGTHGSVTIHSFGVTDTGGKMLERERTEPVAEAISQILLGYAENDPAAGLVLSTGLNWRAVETLITYRNLMQQCNRTYSVAGVNEALLKYPACAQALFQMFDCKFNPGLQGDRKAAIEAARAEFSRHLEKVDSINADKVLRTLLEFLEASVRTNFFLQRDPEIASISVKVSSKQVRVLPHPKPLFEIYVHGPGVEACHLRGGKVARGGLRWSDRPDDFRTEILGLMNTQMVKNSVIVPVGSKGGFVLKRRFPTREQQGQEMVKQYKVFMRGLLDITDNLVRGKVVRPKNVVCHDEPDPYLVVAADKGTAQMSDTANGVSKEYGFWLGDAFASGGSAGYSHKDMGITAKGAWVCVERLFREKGIDLGSTVATCVGIGDMSGDVFGNGMLLSRKLKLVAAFDHRHIFVDPDPDPEKSFKERDRLFKLPASSWLDYRREAMSKGSGIYNRGDKKIVLSPEAKARLGITASSVNGDELVRAILKADVDLFWNGGIGTFIKATDETNLEVGDKTNDEVRVSATEVRAKVIGEGGNLGMTPRSRIEFLRHGGRCSTDAIDNSAGVDCSDHEVNLKILMKLLIDEKLVKDDEERDKILPRFTERVEKHVLRNNYLQSALLSLDELRSREEVESFLSLIRKLADGGFIDREKDKIPSDAELRSRFANGEPVPRSVLAGLTGWVKMVTFDTLLASDLPDQEYYRRIFVDYFPPGIVEKYGNVCYKHHLRREIIATYLTNQVINQAGISLFQRLRAETPEQVRDAVYIYSLIDDLLDGGRIRAAIHALDNKVDAKWQYRELLKLEGVIFATCQRIVRAQTQKHFSPDVIERVAAEVRQLTRKLGDRMSPEIRESLEAEEKALSERHFPKDLARELAALAYLKPLMTMVRIREATDAPLDQVAGLWYRVGDQFQLHYLTELISKVRLGDEWERQLFDSVCRDLVRYHRELTTRVLRDRKDKESLEDSLGRLLARKKEPYDRLTAGVTQLKASGVTALVPVQVLKEHYEEMLAK
ncbi:MAG: NAD-glutamate dehydrogenase [Candidatus Riflebacteria bacterium]|nr:NAD-glutamate dehydrogenase [Candidatus Riflebacteria bacterium]